MIELIASVPFIVWAIIVFVLGLTFWANEDIKIDFKGLLSTLDGLAKVLKKYKTQLSIEEMNDVEELFINAKFKDNYFLKDIWVEFDETVEKDKRNNRWWT